MNLMTMQFGSFVFPVNPTELKLERACLLRETVGVDGEERVEAVGKRKARVAGKGHFTGENAMAVYRELEALFGETETLHAVGGDRRPVEGVLTVEKGVSCFEALQTFSERYLNCTPYTDKSGGVHFESYVPKTVKPDWVTAREVIFCPYKMLSGVTVQNAQTGAYSAEYHDPLAPQVRVRYLSAYAKTAPTALLNESRRAAKRLKLTCASYIDGNMGDTMRTEELGEVRLISKNVLLRGKDVKTELHFEPV